MMVLLGYNTVKKVNGEVELRTSETLLIIFSLYSITNRIPATDIILDSVESAIALLDHGVNKRLKR